MYRRAFLVQQLLRRHGSPRPPSMPSSRKLSSHHSLAVSIGAVNSRVGLATGIAEAHKDHKTFRQGFANAKVMMAGPSLLQPRVIIYDGVCHLCHRGVKWLIKVDRYQKIKFCCLQSEAAIPYLKLCGLDKQDVLKRFVFIEGFGCYHQGSTAVLKVLSYLPFPYSALRCLALIPTPLRDAAYDYVATHRYRWFGASDKCLVLRDVELLERFIDRDELMESRF